MRGKIDNYIQQVFQPTFDSSSLTPVLLYITKQEFGGKKRDRPMHSHQSLCEILLVYRGVGYYTVGKQCYPIQAGDILFYNQGELHEVRSMSDAEIGTYCIGLTGLQMPGLPGNHIIPQGSAPVRDSGARFLFLLQMCGRHISCWSGMFMLRLQHSVWQLPLYCWHVRLKQSKCSSFVRSRIAKLQDASVIILTSILPSP